jgi:ankyrin repeat protein
MVGDRKSKGVTLKRFIWKVLVLGLIVSSTGVRSYGMNKTVQNNGKMVKRLDKVFSEDNCDALKKFLESQHYGSCYDGDPLLHLAIERKALFCVMALLNFKKIDVNQENGKRETALHMTVKRGRPKFLQLLLNHKKIDVNKRDKSGWMVPCQAVKQEKVAILNRFLYFFRQTKPGCIVGNSVRKKGLTPLHLAVIREDPNIIALLLSCEGIEVDKVDKYWNTPLHLAVALENNGVVVLLLGCNVIGVNKKNVYGNTPLHLAVALGNIGFVILLLARKEIRVNKKNAYGDTPLLVAVDMWFGKLADKMEKITTLLLRNNLLDVNTKNKKGETALHIAATRGNVKATEVLLKCKGININLQDGNGNTALSRAICGTLLLDRREVIKMLFNHKDSDVTIQSKKGNNVFHDVAYVDIKNFKKIIYNNYPMFSRIIMDLFSKKYLANEKKKYELNSSGLTLQKI